MIVEASGNRLRQHYEEIVKTTPRRVFGVFLQFLVFYICFFVCFGFCACYKYQEKTWIILVVVSLLLDIIVFEVLIEMSILLFYKSNHEVKRLGKIGRWINQFRKLRCLE